jgi:hypothetical protein
LSDWENERWVKLYVSRNPGWEALPGRSRGLFYLLMTKVHPFTGRISIGGLGVYEAVAVAAKYSIEHVSEDLGPLLDDGCLVIDEDRDELCMPNWVEAQQTRQSDALRKERSRGLQRAMDKQKAEKAAKAKAKRPKPALPPLHVPQLPQGRRPAPAAHPRAASMALDIPDLGAPVPEPKVAQPQPVAQNLTLFDLDPPLAPRPPAPPTRTPSGPRPSGQGESPEGGGDRVSPVGVTRVDGSAERPVTTSHQGLNKSVQDLYSENHLCDQVLEPVTESHQRSPEVTNRVNIEKRSSSSNSPACVGVPVGARAHTREGELGPDDPDLSFEFDPTLPAEDDLADGDEPDDDTDLPEPPRLLRIGPEAREILDLLEAKPLLACCATLRVAETLATFVVQGGKPMRHVVEAIEYTNSVAKDHDDVNDPMPAIRMKRALEWAAANNHILVEKAEKKAAALKAKSEPKYETKTNAYRKNDDRLRPAWQPHNDDLDLNEMPE